MWNEAPAYPTPLILLLSALGIVLCVLGLAALLDLARDWRRGTRWRRASHRDGAGERAADDLQLWAVVTPERDGIVASTIRARREDAEALLARSPFDRPGYHVEPVRVSLGSRRARPARS
jgi:hypothetical protein